jgi:hypothetical protein
MSEDGGRAIHSVCIRTDRPQNAPQVEKFLSRKRAINQVLLLDPKRPQIAEEIHPFGQGQISAQDDARDTLPCVLGPITRAERMVDLTQLKPAYLSSSAKPISN